MDSIITIAEMTVGAAISLGSLYLLAKQKRAQSAAGASSEIDLPFFGRLKTPHSAVLALFIGAGLVFHSTLSSGVVERPSAELALALSEPRLDSDIVPVERVKISGQVVIDGGVIDDYRNVRVYIVPSAHIRVPDSTGRFDDVEIERLVQARALVVYNGQIVREEIISFGDDG